MPSVYGGGNVNIEKDSHSLQRERTLLTAFLLSAWGPLATGIAFIMNPSSTQFADFIRRTVELLALFISWYIFRFIHRNNIMQEKRAGLEGFARLSVSIALGSAGFVIFITALINIRSSGVVGSNPWIGLGVAFLGAFVNMWFWKKYSVFYREKPDGIIDSQRRLYRAKSFLDICVLVSLSIAVLAPLSLTARYVDFLGSISVALYLFIISLKRDKTDL